MLMFLVRPKRAAELARRWPRYDQSDGDVTLKILLWVEVEELAEKSMWCC